MQFGTIRPLVALQLSQQGAPRLRVAAGAALAQAAAARPAMAARLCAELVLHDLPGLASDRDSLLLVVQALLVAQRLAQLSRLLRSLAGAAVSVLPGMMGGPSLVAISTCPRTGALLLVVNLAALAGPAGAQAAATLLDALPD